MGEIPNDKLHSNQVTIEEIRLLPEIGSDHRPVMFEMRIAK